MNVLEGLGDVPRGLRAVSGRFLRVSAVIQRISRGSQRISGVFIGSWRVPEDPRRTQGRFGGVGGSEESQGPFRRSQSWSQWAFQWFSETLKEFLCCV